MKMAWKTNRGQIDFITLSLVANCIMWRQPPSTCHFGLAHFNKLDDFQQAINMCSVRVVCIFVCRQIHHKNAISTSFNWIFQAMTSAKLTSLWWILRLLPWSHRWTNSQQLCRYFTRVSLQTPSFGVSIRKKVERVYWKWLTCTVFLRPFVQSGSLHVSTSMAFRSCVISILLNSVK